MHEQLAKTWTTPRTRPTAAGHLRWLEMSFTNEGFEALKSYRRRLSLETGKTVSLGFALDRMLKSHPAAYGVAR